MRYTLERIDPVGRAVVDPSEQSESAALFAVTIEDKYEFYDADGETFHSHTIGGEPDFDTCGGYVGKVIDYRDPRLYDHLAANGVSRESFGSNGFPLLATRSPQLDLVIFGALQLARESFSLDRVALFDLGCTVAEHYDLLDVMFRVTSGGREGASDVLSYHGLDRSSQLLSFARVLHQSVPTEHFVLRQQEGSAFEYADDEFDFSLSVGVVNHVADPRLALEKLIRITRYGCVLALWHTRGPEAKWAINHRGVPSYFFADADLAEMEELGGGRFYVADFVPEFQSSQQASYVNVTAEEIEELGSYHIVYTAHPSLVPGLEPLFA